MAIRSLLVAAVVVAVAGPARALPPAPLEAGWEGVRRSAGLGTPALVPAPELVLALLAGEADGGEPEGEGGSEEDFDLFGDTEARQAELANPGLEKEIRRRRSMLRTHQLLGITTLTLMTATAIVGQVNHANTYGSDADGNDSLRLPHMVLSYATTASFATTAYFSLFAPKPIERESSGLDTVTLHKLAVLGATAGMLAQVGLGFSAARSADAGHPTRPGDLAAVHQVIGWTTLGFLAAAATVWIF